MPDFNDSYSEQEENIAPAINEPTEPSGKREATLPTENKTVLSHVQELVS